jgi:hypothetical protein
VETAITTKINKNNKEEKHLLKIRTNRFQKRMGRSSRHFKRLNKKKQSNATKKKRFLKIQPKPT